MASNKLLKTVSQKAATHQINEETNISDIPQEDMDRIIYLTDDMLIDDPLNQEMYGDNEVEALAEDMRKGGFQGVILAYPYEKKYRIESGHRRRESARIAGIHKYRIYVTETPKTEYERRLRLVQGNLHNRIYTPIIIAREADFLFDTYKMNQKELKKQGLETQRILELVAKKLGKSTVMITRYRRLLKLIPELQTLLDCDPCPYPWNYFLDATKLSTDKQKDFYNAIIKLPNDSKITEAWCQKEIKKLASDAQIEELNKSPEDIKDNKDNGRVRRKNGTKAVIKGSNILREVLDGDALFKKEEIPAVVRTLEEIIKSSQKKLEELKSMSEQ